MAPEGQGTFPQALPQSLAPKSAPSDAQPASLSRRCLPGRSGLDRQPVVLFLVHTSAAYDMSAEGFCFLFFKDCNSLFNCLPVD